MEIQVGGKVELHTARHQPGEAKLGQVSVDVLGMEVVVSFHEGAVVGAIDNRSGLCQRHNADIDEADDHHCHGS